MGPQRKPTGKIGAIAVRPTERRVTFEPVEFPETKEEIEQFVAERFYRATEESGLLDSKLISAPEKNVTDDFDFTLHTEQGQKYLELMEVAPLEHIRGSYDKAPNFYNEYDFGKYIFEKILGKSKRYQGVTDHELYLLVYITHWKFALSRTVITLLRYWSLEGKHCFARIFYLSHLSSTDVVVYLMYPMARELFEGFDENRFRDNIALLLTGNFL